jgi:hypothetical protein
MKRFIVVFLSGSSHVLNEFVDHRELQAPGFALGAIMILAFHGHLAADIDFAVRGQIRLKRASEFAMADRPEVVIQQPGSDIDIWLGFQCRS